MNIGRIDRQVLKMMNVAKVIRKVELSPKEYKHMNEACYKFSDILGQPAAKLQEMTRGGTLDNFTFLKTMVNKFNHQKFHAANDNSEHILNIYSMVEKPTALHLNIVRKSNDSFESLEKIFSLAKDEKTLQFVEDLQYGELRNSNNSSKIIIDLLNSKNKDRYIENTERYSSFLELNADDDNVVKNLDALIDSGKYSRFKSEAKLAIKKLFKKQRIESAMGGKTNDLEKMYTEERNNFLTSLVNHFIPVKKAPKDDTKAAVVQMYGTMNSSNAKLRKAIVERFSYAPVKDRAAEIVEMQTLFNKIDKDKDTKSFVEKAIKKDLKITSIAELNEILDSVLLKKSKHIF